MGCGNLAFEQELLIHELVLARHLPRIETLFEDPSAPGSAQFGQPLNGVDCFTYRYRRETSLYDWPLHKPAVITSVSDRSAALSNGRPDQTSEAQ